MDFFRLLMILPTLSAELSKAMADREVTVKEVIDIVDKVLQGALGKSLDDVGLAIRKRPDGKVKIEFIF